MILAILSHYEPYLARPMLVLGLGNKSILDVFSISSLYYSRSVVSRARILYIDHKEICGQVYINFINVSINFSNTTAA